MASKEKKLVQERVTVDPYGDQRIEEAKGTLEQLRRETAE
jgi:dynein regulatory complex protein 1